MPLLNLPDDILSVISEHLAPDWSRLYEDKSVSALAAWNQTCKRIYRLSLGHLWRFVSWRDDYHVEELREHLHLLVREVYVNAVRPRRQGFTKKGLSWQWGSTFCDAHVIVFTWPDTTSESFRGSESDPDDMQIHMSLKGHPLSFACLSGLRYDIVKGVDLNAWDLMPQFPFAVPFKYYLGWTLRTLVARDQASLPISWIYEVLANSWDKFGVRVTF